ncbi:MAG: hypothetical protein GX039_04580 [Clostridia bacterium]|nr:hypothetical protein [Clostridia bacterium]
MSEARETGKTKKQPSLALKVLLIVLVIICWGGIVYGAGYYAKQYIDSSIQAVQQTNALNVRALEDRLEELSNDMQEIKMALESTDQTISSSDSTQRELSNRITQLDQQLQELQRSLMILKEAPNAPN